MLRCREVHVPIPGKTLDVIMEGFHAKLSDPEIHAYCIYRYLLQIASRVIYTKQNLGKHFRILIHAYGLEADGMASVSFDIRIEDYLNDKLQTSADLESLDSLLENVKARQNVLKQQLEDAVKTLDEVNTASQIHSAKVLQQAENFQKYQADIDRRLLIVTRSETSDDAVRKFESSMNKLQRLEITQKYMETLREVDNLWYDPRVVCNMRPNSNTIFKR